MGNAADPRRDGEVRGPRHLGDDGAAHPARGGAAGRTRGDRTAGEAAAAVRAGGAEPALAERHLHVRAATESAAVRGGVSGRSLALPRVVGDGASPEVDAGAGGDRARDGGVRRAARGADRPGAAVHGVAWRDRVRAAAAATRHRACEEPAAASADAGEDRALLEDALGGVPGQDGVRGLCGLSAADGAVHPALQLPATASGARRRGPRRPVLPRGGARARGGRGPGGGERAAPGAGEAAAQALLPGRPAGRSGPEHRGGRRSAARADGGRSTDHPAAEGGSR